MPDADVFIATPVYDGADVLPETLRSMQAQTYGGFRALVSIDAGDTTSRAACEIVRDDPRFAVVVQPERLGWPGHFNWLAERCDRQFFTYWQQDDHVSTDYLDVLRRELLANPGTAVAYCDVQYFGAKVDRDTAASFDGTPLARVLAQLESLSYVPLRGLIRAGHLPRGVAAIPDTRDGGAQQESVFHARLAAQGAFTRVEGPLYFKRAHPAATSLRLMGMAPHRRRREAAHMGAALLALALEHAPPGSDGRLLATVLDRLCIARPGRGFFYVVDHDLRAVREMALQLADEGGLDLGDDRWAIGPASGLERPVHPLVFAALAAERERARALRGAAPPAAARLGWGWHEAEAAGAWSDGVHAALELGDHAGGGVVLRGRVFAPAGPVRVGWSLTGDEDELVAHTGEVVVAAAVPMGARRLHLHLPDAISPHAASVSTDPRRIGFHLESIEIAGRQARVAGSE